MRMIVVFVTIIAILAQIIGCAGSISPDKHVSATVTVYGSIWDPCNGDIPPDGIDVEGAYLQLVPQQGGGDPYEATTDSDGRYEFTGVEPLIGLDLIEYELRFDPDPPNPPPPDYSGYTFTYPLNNWKKFTFPTSTTLERAVPYVSLSPYLDYSGNISLAGNATTADYANVKVYEFFYLDSILVSTGHWTQVDVNGDWNHSSRYGTCHAPDPRSTDPSVTITRDGWTGPFHFDGTTTGIDFVLYKP